MVRIFPRVGADSLSARAAVFWLQNNVWRRVEGGVPDAPCGFMFAAFTRVAAASPLPQTVFVLKILLVPFLIRKGTDKDRKWNFSA